MLAVRVGEMGQNTLWRIGCTKANNRESDAVYTKTLYEIRYVVCLPECIAGNGRLVENLLRDFCIEGGAGKKRLSDKEVGRGSCLVVCKNRDSREFFCRPDYRYSE